MGTRKTACFTGMDAADGEKLKGLFVEANRRVGDAWTLAPENDADMLIIDVDSLYGHMTWLKVHHSGRIIIALSESAKAEADQVLLRPVTVESLAALLAQHAGVGVSSAPTPIVAANPAPNCLSRAPHASCSPLPFRLLFRRLSRSQPRSRPRCRRVAETVGQNREHP